MGRRGGIEAGKSTGSKGGWAGEVKSLGSDVDEVQVKKHVQLDKYPVTQIKDQDVVDKEEDTMIVVFG